MFIIENMTDIFLPIWTLRVRCALSLIGFIMTSFMGSLIRISLGLKKSTKYEYKYYSSLKKSTKYEYVWIIFCASIYWPSPLTQDTKENPFVLESVDLRGFLPRINRRTDRASCDAINTEKYWIYPHFWEETILVAALQYCCFHCLCQGINDTLNEFNCWWYPSHVF